MIEPDEARRAREALREVVGQIAGMTLVNMTGAGDVGTDDGRMMLRIKGALARREVEQMSKRLKRKYLENAEDGKPHGRAPYGM
jgi:DNA invertase Pin-like site-specific DNA recombinase